MDAAGRSGDAPAFVESLLLALASDASAEGGVVDLTSGTSSSGTSGASSCLNRARDLLTSSLRIVTQKLAKQIKDEISVDAKAGGNEQVFLKMEDVQCFEPRGRFNASFTANGLLLEGKNANGFIPWESVSHVSAFPSNATTKKEGEDMLAMRLSPAVKFAGKDMSGVLFSLSKCLGTPVTATLRVAAAVDTGAGGAAATVQGTHAVVVPQVIAELWGRPVVAPRKELFQSVSTGPGGATRPYLRCHRGVQEGAIYPLSNGVVFVKPLLFLPAEEIASLTAGRGGGSGQTRYVDLKIETADDKVHEFVNIEREELPALQAYVKGYLETRAKEAELRRKEEKKKEGGVDGAGDDDDDDDSEDDEDFDPDASDDEDDDDSDASGNSDGEVDDDDDNSKVSEADAAPAKKKAKRKASPGASFSKENHQVEGMGENEAKEAEAAEEPEGKRVRLEEALEA